MMKKKKPRERERELKIIVQRFRCMVLLRRQNVYYGNFQFFHEVLCFLYE